MKQAGIKSKPWTWWQCSDYIDKNADLVLAAKRCAFGAFYNSGQVCISLQKIYVNEEFMKHLPHGYRNKALKMGSPYEEDTFMGQLVDEESRDRAKHGLLQQY